MRLTDLVGILAPTPRSQKIHVRRQWEARIGQACGKGTDSDDAIHDLEKKIRHAFDGNYNANAVVYRGSLAVVWRTPEHWCYQILGLKDLAEQPHRLWGTTSGFLTEEEALKSIRSHLAQNEWDGIEEESPLIINREDQDDFRRWVKWQKEYKRLRGEGMDDNTARNHIQL